MGCRGCLEGQGSGTSCRPRTDSSVSSSPALILRMVMQRPVCDKDHILNSMQSLLCCINLLNGPEDILLQGF